MEELPRFHLFSDPLKEKSIVTSKAYCKARDCETCACDICGRERDYYCDCGHVSDDPALDEITICPWCIADGTAASRGIRFNDATIYPDLGDTPQLSAADREVVEGRTPGFATWQQIGWRMCCGRACIYVGEANSSDLKGRWASAVPTLFESDGMEEPGQQEVLTHIGEGIGVYIFQCQICGCFSGHWDSA